MVFAPPLPGPETRDMAFVFDELYYKTLGEMAEFLDSGQAEFITVCKRIHVYPFRVL